MRLGNALIRLRVCAGWSEPLLVAHTTLLETSCRGSYGVSLLSESAAIPPEVQHQVFGEIQAPYFWFCVYLKIAPRG